VAELVMQTHMSKTDANLLYKMLHSPGFNINDLAHRNVQSMHEIVDQLVDQVTFVNSFEPFVVLVNAFARVPERVSNHHEPSPQPFAPHDFQGWLDREIASDKKLKRLATKVRCPLAWLRNTLHSAIKMVENPNFSGDWDYDQKPMCV
jgi:hypothetical protein